MTTGPAVARRRRPYLRLLQKEAAQAFPTVLAFSAALVGWFVFLYTRIGRWDPLLTIFPLSLLPWGFIPMWALWRTVASLRQEWAGNHMHLLLALPMPGWYITSVKGLVVFLETVWYGALSLSGFLATAAAMGVLGLMMLSGQMIGWAMVVAALLMAVLWTVSVIAVVQFVYIVGRLAFRGRIFVSAAALLVSGWLILRIGTWSASLFRWVPPLRMRSTSIIDGVMETHEFFLGFAAALGALLVVAALFWFGSSLLERDVEL